jgi:LmbE family N-acetylglucosaminyl deacetylase
MYTILAISAHPDDETGFAGGTLACYAELGHDVYILETTRGEGGEVGEPPLTSKENLGSFREREARRAARILGARDIFFLPFIDPHMEINGIARRIDVPLADFARAIAGHLETLRPDVVITHGSNGEYGHPQHVYTHRATRRALADAHLQITLLSWCAWYEPCSHARILNRDDPADVVVDISPWHAKKVDAAMCHRTQHAMFLRNTGAATVADMIWKTESFRIWNGQLPRELATAVGQ